MNNFIINFWYGKLPLWKSYWLMGELINALIILLIYTIEIRLFNNSLLYKQLPFLNFTGFHLISKLAFFSWTIFITVGIWRAAEAYKGTFVWIVITLILLSYRIFTLRFIIF